jgi:hypothetical protein
MIERSIDIDLQTGRLGLLPFVKSLPRRQALLELLEQRTFLPGGFAPKLIFELRRRLVKQNPERPLSTSAFQASS